MWARNIDSFSD